MRNIIITIIFYLPKFCTAQELDTLQADSIYAKNAVSRRIMYVLYDNTLQNELVTDYNKHGQMTQRTWFWNGETNFHNSEFFQYNASGSLAAIVDTFVDKHVTRTKFIYQNKVLTASVEIDQNGDTVNYRMYPSEEQTIHRWYRSGKPYRYDTTLFEKRNVKIAFNGKEASFFNSQDLVWHYIYNNYFDAWGNLIRTDYQTDTNAYSSIKYFYNDKGLLLKKESVSNNRAGKRNETYYFVYE